MSVPDRVLWVVAVAPAAAMVASILTAAGTIGAHTIRTRLTRTRRHGAS